MYIAIDVGASKTRTASSDDLINIAAEKDWATPQNFQEGMELLLAAIGELLAGKQPEAVVMGLPGILDRPAGKIKLAPNLPHWSGQPAVAALSERLQTPAFITPVFIENDTALGGLGEAAYGAGRDKEIAAYLALGTGVGGCRIVNQNIDRASQGFEPGHQLIIPEGDLWSCGQRGCLEAYVSGTAFQKRYGLDPKECQDRKIWEEYGRYLGRGIINLITLWSPEVIVLGGSMARSAPLFLPPLQAFVDENLKVLRAPPIIQGALDDKAGVYGGFSYLRTRLQQ